MIDLSGTIVYFDSDPEPFEFLRWVEANTNHIWSTGQKPLGYTVMHIDMNDAIRFRNDDAAMLRDKFDSYRRLIAAGKYQGYVLKSAAEVMGEYDTEDIEFDAEEMM